MSMQALAGCLTQFLEKHVRDAFAREGVGRVQPELVGPPLPALEAVFQDLTSNGDAWTTQAAGGQQVHVYTLLVVPEPTVPPAGDSHVSQRCNWDYAVTIRNSIPACVVLSTREAWDRRHESLANTSETLGDATARTGDEQLSDALWSHVVLEVATRAGVDEGLVRWLLNGVREDAANLGDPSESLTWDVVDRMLGADSSAALVRAAGLPKVSAPELTTDDLKRSRKTLAELADLCRAKGIEDARGELASVANDLESKSAVPTGTQAAISQLLDHVRSNAGNGAAFEQSPQAYFRPEAGWGWYELLDDAVLRALLQAVGATRPDEKVKLTCQNALNRSDLLPREPLVVTGEVELHASSSGGSADEFDFYRRVKRGFDPLPGTPVAGRLVDAQAPAHGAPLTYLASATDHKSASIKVISLSSFQRQGHLRIRGALANPPPPEKQEQAQEITVSGAGVHDVVVFCAPGVASVQVSRGVQFIQLPLDTASHRATEAIALEEDDEFVVTLRDSNGDVLSEWRVKIAVDDPSGLPPRTRFEALVRAQSRGQEQAVVKVVSLARDLERSFVGSAESWRGVLAYWPSPLEATADVEWTKAVLGDPSGSDPRPPRPQADPPASYLARREEVRNWIAGQEPTIAELVLSNPEPRDLIARYLGAYASWLSENPGAAAWTDCIAVYAPEENPLTATLVQSGEPVVLLLSPLHPLRLAWHCHAQVALSGALLDGNPCPAASLIHPHVVPGISAIPLHQGDGVPEWRAFMRGDCEEPHWSLLWNSKAVSRGRPHGLLGAILSKIGFPAADWIVGFTPAQASRAIDEVNRILPTRSSLRVGIVGENGASTGVIAGTMDWCLRHFERREGAVLASLPLACDVYDLREQPSRPTPSELSLLVEDTRAAVRWFVAPPTQQRGRLDMVIMDEVGGQDPEIVSARGEGISRSPLGHGALSRIDVRRDYDAARVLEESRVGRRDSAGSDLGTVVAEVAVRVEGLVAEAVPRAVYRFRPNQQALEQRLGEAMFVAASSTQVDPACFSRGARAAGGYLWDYELPGGDSSGAERAGYYLIASPPGALREAIAATAEAVTGQSLDPDTLLDEISRRGIPVLRRVTRGGSQARGELGVLVTVRWLQDVFRAARGPVRLPVFDGQLLHLILPVDSYWRALRQFRGAGGESAEHPDLVLFSILVPTHGLARVAALPIEVKFREGKISQPELAAAQKQAENLGSRLAELWSESPANALWDVCGRHLLAQCLDHCFRVYADQGVHGRDPAEWTELHERVLHDVLVGAPVTVDSHGRVIAVDGSTLSEPRRSGPGKPWDCVVIGREDARRLLAGNGVVDPLIEDAIGTLEIALPLADSGPGPNDEGTGPTGTPPGEGPTAPGGPEPPVAPEQGSVAPAGDLPGGEPTATEAERPDGLSPIRERVRSAFEGFIGNAAAVKRISNDIIAAFLEDPPHLSKNYLFTGQPSTGKTEISRRIASALGLPLVKLDGQGLVNRERLFELIRAELRQQGLKPTPQGRDAERPVLRYPPLVVFIDEVHLVSRAVQEGLLTVLEASDRSLGMEKEVARMDLVTFIFATTRPSAIDNAFRSRCAEVSLREYTEEQVADMVRARFPYPEWSPEVYLRIARLGRRVPRIAIELARELETEIKVTEHPERTVLAHMEEVRVAREIDELGLTVGDWDYLEMLDRQGPVGEHAIVKMLGTVDKNRVTEEIEPFLLRLGFMSFGQRGREITAAGRRYLRTGNRPIAAH